MKSTFTYRSEETPWPPLLQQQLETWQRTSCATRAEVVLEHQGGNAVAYRVKVWLELVGRVLRADVSAATLEGALALVTGELEQQLRTTHPPLPGRKARLAPPAKLAAAAPPTRPGPLRKP